MADRYGRTRGGQGRRPPNPFPAPPSGHPLAEIRRDSLPSLSQQGYHFPPSRHFDNLVRDNTVPVDGQDRAAARLDQARERAYFAGRGGIPALSGGFPEAARENIFGVSAIRGSIYGLGLGVALSDEFDDIAYGLGVGLRTGNFDYFGARLEDSVFGVLEDTLISAEPLAFGVLGGLRDYLDPLADYAESVGFTEIEEGLWSPPAVPGFQRTEPAPDHEQGIGGVSARLHDLFGTEFTPNPPHQSWFVGLTQTETGAWIPDYRNIWTDYDLVIEGANAYNFRNDIGSGLHPSRARFARLLGIAPARAPDPYRQRQAYYYANAINQGLVGSGLHPSLERLGFHNRHLQAARSAAYAAAVQRARDNFVGAHFDDAYPSGFHPSIERGIDRRRGFRDWLARNPLYDYNNVPRDLAPSFFGVQPSGLHPSLERFADNQRGLREWLARNPLYDYNSIQQYPRTTAWNVYQTGRWLHGREYAGRDHSFRYDSHAEHFREDLLAIVTQLPHMPGEIADVVTGGALGEWADNFVDDFGEAFNTLSEAASELASDVGSFFDDVADFVSGDDEGGGSDYDGGDDNVGDFGEGYGAGR